MKHLLIICLLLLVACSGGGSDPVQPDPVQNNAPRVTSGMFDITAVQTINNCEQDTVWDGAYSVEIDSLAFSMGSWTGNWNPTKAQAAAEGPQDVTVTRGCTVTRGSSIYITFSSPDKFSGTILYRLRLKGDCGTRTTCTTSWVVTGTRQTAPAP